MRIDDLDILLPVAPAEQTVKPRWGTITQLSPLRVKLDGDDTALPVTPSTLVRGLVVGSRVWCALVGRQLVIVGSYGGDPVPPPVRASLWGSTTGLAYGVWTRLDFASSSLAGGITLDSGGLKVPVSGWYLVTMEAQIGDTGWGVLHDLFEIRANATVGGVTARAGNPAGPWTRVSASSAGELAAGAVVQGWASLYRTGTTPLVDASLTVTKLG